MRTGTVLQMEVAECGAACLTMVLHHLGRDVDLGEVRGACATSRDGVNALSIVRAARTFGLRGTGMRRSAQELRGLPGPMVVFWNQNHFLLVEGFGRRHVYLNDPAVGRRRVSLDDFEAGYSGIVLTFEAVDGVDSGRRAGRRPPLITALVRTSRSGLLFAVLAGLTVVVPTTIASALTALFVEEVLAAQDTGLVNTVILIAVLVAVLTVVLTLLQQLALLRMRSILAGRLAAAFLWHLLRLPSRFFDARSPGGLVGRMQLTTRIATLVSGQLATAGIGAVTVVLFAAVLLWWNLPLGLAAVALASVNGVVLVAAARTQQAVNQDLQQNLVALSGYTYTGISMLDDLKATGSENEYFAHWAGVQARVVAAEQRLGLLSQSLVIVPGFLLLANTVVLLGVGGFLVLAGELSVGGLVAFQALSYSFFAPISQLVSVAGQFQNARAWLQQVYDVLDQPVTPGAAAGPTYLTVPGREPVHAPQPAVARASVIDAVRPAAVAREDTRRLRGHLELRGVTFGYTTSQPPLLQDFDLEVRPGQRVALVGGSGSGKSTVAKLVSGLLQPWSGQILLDGVPRDEVPPETLAASLAHVDQSVMLFSGTAAENISFFDASLPAADLMRAAQDACIAADIEARPGGFDTTLTEGGRNLSGGQRQRLEIARALARNPTVLVLDEATSALDATTEARIDAQLRRRACTCLIVAHRLSTVRDCDQILVLDAGRVAERGTHEELLAQGGLYRGLIDRA